MWIFATSLDGMVICPGSALHTILFLRILVTGWLLGLVQLTYSPNYGLFHKRAMLLTFLVIGTVVTAILGLAADSSYLPFVTASLMLWSILFFGTAHVPHTSALVVSAAVIGAYEAVLLTHCATLPVASLLLHSFFVVSACVAASYAQYSTERCARTVYQLRKRAARAEKDTADTRQREAIAQAKTRFIAGVSHELRTPLHGIMGLANSLLNCSHLEQEEAETVRIIIDCAFRLAGITEDLLDVAQLDQQGATALSLHLAPFSFMATVEDVMDVTSWRAFTKDLDVGQFISGSVPQRLVGDAGRLRQILLNLVGNAVKFTETGYLYLEAHATVDKKDKSIVWLHVRVRDTGIGIPVEARKDLFQPLSQVDDSRERRYGGAGVGLYLSRLLIEAMGGSISVGGGGSPGIAFTFSVPLHAVKEEEEKEKEAKSLSSIPSGKAKPFVAVCTRFAELSQLMCKQLEETGNFTAFPLTATADLTALEQEVREALSTREWLILVLHKAVVSAPHMTAQERFLRAVAFANRLHELWPTRVRVVLLVNQNNHRPPSDIPVVRSPVKMEQLASVLLSLSPSAGPTQP